MPATKITCCVIDKKWLTPTVVQVRFTTTKKFKFHAGQFISLVIPPPRGQKKPLRRAYSFSLPPNQPFYELCVKHVKGGPGSTYVANLRVGERFEATAAYGEFVFQARPGRNACFICTGTGIAPFRAIALSDEFQENRPEKSWILFGARTTDEILYAQFFHEQKIMPLIAVSKPGPDYRGFVGRVTDYIRALPHNWDWHLTDFYICGNGDMVQDVQKLLIQNRGINPENIFAEMYFVSNGIVDPFTGKILAKAA